jgi:lipoprotein-anchoring transpeptidase ErfK/SrfK
VRRYVIDADDVAGPFSPHPPQDPAAMAAADQLGWATPVEELAEAFHMDEGLLKALNPRARFRPGDTILVVERGGDDLGEDVTRIEVDGKAGLVRAYGAGDRLLAAYPATVGGKLGPPEGTLTVEAISPQPAWDFQSQRPTLSSADSRRSVEIAPGPNNPVGAVWIELSDHRCGLHGSPDPANVGEPGGAGCVRLTNWDARELARGAMPGAVVSFR